MGHFGVLETLWEDIYFSPNNYKAMFLKLSHTKMDIYKCSRELALSCYSLTKKFPADERFCLVQQIRRAALSIHLNLSEGCSRKSVPEHKRYFEISRGSVVEVDTALDIAQALNYSTLNEMQPTGDLIIRTFTMLSKMIDDKDAS